MIADERRPLALLVEEGAVRPATERILLAALRVKGVPRISVEEALWTAAELLLAGSGR